MSRVFFKHTVLLLKILISEEEEKNINFMASQDVS